MSLLDDVLVYVDPSPRGEWALSLAALLPRADARRVWLLATAEDVAADPGLLDRARARLGPATVEAITRPGPAERAVVEEAASGRYGLVVVPPAGRGALQRLLRGSRIATIVRRVRAPVLVARRPPPRLERVLAAVSEGELTGAVCDAASQLAGTAGASVTWLHVVSELALPGAPAPARDAAETAHEPLRAQLRARGVDPSALLLREGLAAEEVLAEFENGAHHLLVLGASASASGFGREDVTERVLLRCPGSVLIVHLLADSAHAPVADSGA
jgi:nucleotide-binding universal stress UspA family protein